MRRSLLLRLSPGLLLLSACTFHGRFSVGSDASGPPAEQPPPTAHSAKESTATTAPTWTAKRYVVLLEDPRACAPVDGWDAIPMFGKSAAAGPTAGKPDPRGRFCVISWNGKGEPAGAPAVGKTLRMDADRDVAVPQAPAHTGGPPQVLRRQARQAREALGAAVPTNARAPKAWLYKEARAADVAAPPYVAVVDTADSSAPGIDMPAYYTTDAAQHHGLMMRGLMDAIRCPYGTSECRGRQFFVQAMPYDASHHVPQPSGGRRGSLGSLAVAIDDAVDQWKALPDSTSSPLIINLSVGWDIRSLDLPPGDDPSVLLDAPSAGVPSPVQAVYVALARASCEGALVIAASGNHRGQPCREQGPMGPAAWERLDAPTDCSMFGTAGSPPKGPLVYAAGGLDEYDQPIANSRIDSLPRRALYAHKAVLPAEGNEFTQPWTGTSVATASLSAIAASVWSHQPGLRADQVMDIIDQSGVALPLKAWIVPRGMDSAQVHRIDAQSVFAKSVPGAVNPYLARPQLGSPALREKIASKTHVILYVDPGYGGQSQTLEVGRYDIDDLTIGNDTLSSLRIPEGYQVTLYHAWRMGGDSLVLTSDTPALEGLGEGPDGPFDDATSSIVVESISGEAPACAPADSSPLDALTVETRPQPHVPVCPTCTITKSTSAGENPTTTYTMTGRITLEPGTSGFSSLPTTLSGTIVQSNGMGTWSVTLTQVSGSTTEWDARQMTTSTTASPRWLDGVTSVTLTVTSGNRTVSLAEAIDVCAAGDTRAGCSGS